MNNTYNSIKDLFAASPANSNPTAAGFLTMKYQGYVNSAHSSSYLLEADDTYLLLYTISGNGSVSIGKHSLSLTKDTLLFLPANNGIRIASSTSVWNFFACSVSGQAMDSYYHSFSQMNKNPYVIPVYSDIPSYIKRIDICRSITGMLYTMTVSKLLTDLLTELCVDIYTQDYEAQHIPYYLLQLKSILDTSYQQAFSLSEYENQFGISKYRLCREFSQYFHTSPLQYLNARRMEVAKDLLLSTTMPVHEVGSTVGIDNTNHFINLFKKSTGATPLAYKQEAPASIRVLHYPYRPDDLLQ